MATGPRPGPRARSRSDAPASPTDSLAFRPICRAPRLGSSTIVAPHQRRGSARLRRAWRVEELVHKRKLIEVALPLEAINRESAREKSIRHGHPSTLHLWWARRPLAAARAVLFAQLVDDPSSQPDEFPTEELQRRSASVCTTSSSGSSSGRTSATRSSSREAHAEILKSTGGNPPAILDPFAGGGTIPLEAQRLGLEAHASDLNPVAVLINKALIEIPPKFADQPPVFPGLAEQPDPAWKGAEGLAADVRAYGAWMRDEAEERHRPLYPKATRPTARRSRSSPGSGHGPSRARTRPAASRCRWCGRGGWARRRARKPTSCRRRG